MTGVEEQLQLTNWCDCYVYLEGLTEVRTIDERVENVKACLGVSSPQRYKHLGLWGFVPQLFTTPTSVRTIHC